MYDKIKKKKIKTGGTKKKKKKKESICEAGDPVHFLVWEDPRDKG